MVDSSFPSCSANHLFFLLVSARATLILFISIFVKIFLFYAKILTYLAYNLLFPVFLSSVDKKQLFWFFQRWLLCRQKPNVLFVRWAFFVCCPTFFSYTQAGIFTIKLPYEELNFKFPTFLSYKAQNPCLRIGDVVSWPSVHRHCQVAVCLFFKCHFIGLSVGLSVAFFIFFLKEGKFLKTILSCVGFASSLTKLWSVLGLVRLWQCACK